LIEADPGEQLGSLKDDDIIELYKAHGAVLFRGFERDLDAFAAFADRFCATSVQNDSRNRAILDTSRNIQSVDRGRGAFPLHPELSREPWKPDVCLFYCVQPPSTGGRTTICDGVKVAELLPAGLRSKMAERRLVYIQRARPAVLEYWFGNPDPSDLELANPPDGCPYSFERVGSEVARLFSRPFLHHPMFSEGVAFGNFLLFARHGGVTGFPLLDDRTPVPDSWAEEIQRVSGELMSEVAWREGDLLMLDNTRFMHGRTAIVDEEERSIASHFGYLRFARPDPEEPPNALWRRPGFRPPPAL
jgi:alpha-ketoglutarate-dependent taurine dioxygenase